MEAKGRLQWARRGELIEQEQQMDGWYLLHTNLAAAQCDARQTLVPTEFAASGGGVLPVEELSGERPVFHWRPDASSTTCGCVVALLVEKPAWV